MKQKRYTVRADRLCPAAGGERHGGGRNLPQARRIRADLLSVKKQFAGMGTTEIRRLKQLEGETA
jgi:hypothetical protein